MPKNINSSNKTTTQIDDWSRKVIEAHRRIRFCVRRTPLQEMAELRIAESIRVYAKLENQQETGSFKLRGATNRILQLSDKERAAGIVAASNGNHGLGVAAAAKKAGVSAHIYVSNQVAPEKAGKIEKLGSQIVYAGSDPLDAERAGRQKALESGKVFISPYNDWDVLAGQGTIAVELLEQVRHLDAIFVAVGGGGLIGGIGAYLKHASPWTEIVGCWPQNSQVMFKAMKGRRIIPVAEEPTLSESTAGGLEEGSVTLEVCCSVVDTCVLVSEQEILDAMRLVHVSRGWLIEGAAGVALAAFLKRVAHYEGKTVAIVICGGNLSQRVKDLL